MRITRLAIVLTACFWLIVVIQQIAWIPHAMLPRFTEDPLIGHFARSYVVTSSLRIFLFVVIAAALSIWFYRSQRRWLAAALCILFICALWQYFIVGLPLFFRPPMGDGSFHGAVVGFVRFRSTGLWLDFAKLFLVLGSFILWLIVFSRTPDVARPKV
jgi:hypothetical protein